MTDLFKPGGRYKWCLIKGHGSVSDEIIEDILSKSFEIWTRYLNITITKSERKLDIDADIKIGFYSKEHQDDQGKPCKSTFDGRSGKLAHSTYPSNTYSAYIHFDSDEPWLFSEKITLSNYFSKRPLFKTVAIHEIGHILGLPHNSKVNSVMNGTYSRFVTLPTKHDIETLQKKLQENPNAPRVKEELQIISWSKTYYQEITIIGLIILVIVLYKILPRKNIQRQAAERLKQFQRLFQ